MLGFVRPERCAHWHSCKQDTWTWNLPMLTDVFRLSVITGTILSSLQFRLLGKTCMVDIFHNCYQSHCTVCCLYSSGGYSSISSQGPEQGAHVKKFPVLYQLWCWCAVFWITTWLPHVFYLPHCKMDDTYLFHQSDRALAWFFTADGTLELCKRHCFNKLAETPFWWQGTHWELCRVHSTEGSTAIQTAEGLCI